MTCPGMSMRWPSRRQGRLTTTMRPPGFSSGTQPASMLVMPSARPWRPAWARFALLLVLPQLLLRVPVDNPAHLVASGPLGTTSYSDALIVSRQITQRKARPDPL